MADDFSGIDGSVIIGTAGEEPFGSWSINFDVGLQDRRSFKSRGMPRKADGQKDFTLELEGPWRVDNTPLTMGHEYLFNCNVDDDNTLPVTGRVKGMVPSQDMEKGPRLKVTVEGSDDFEPTLIQLTRTTPAPFMAPFPHERQEGEPFPEGKVEGSEVATFTDKPKDASK